MADDANVSRPPPNDPHVQPTPPTAPSHATTAPAAAPAARPRFSVVDAGKDLLRAALNLLIGAAVGGLAGLILNFTLLPLMGWTIDLRLVVGAGVLFGLFFNHAIVRLLRLTPRKEREAQAAAGKAPDDGSAPSPVRETVEMLVSVVILVVLLKSFDAEAYVIPTGSMAETLYGDQKEIVCPACGYKFPVDCSDQVDTMKERHFRISGAVCPNCRQHIELVPHEQWTNSNPPPVDAVLDPDCNGGDRILAGKFMYDLFGAPPDRLDVVVFKFPGNPYSEDQNFPPSGAFHDGVQINYIKRLIGLPGETIAIHDGDLYVLAADKGLRYPGDLDIAKQTTGSGMDPARRLWEKRFLHTNDEEALKRFANHEFVIIRKPPETLLTMRRIVYDNDHPAKDLADFHQPPRWADLGKGTGWASDGKNGFRLEAANAGAERRLSYRHLLRDERMEWRARKAKLKSLVQKDAALRAHLNQLKDPMKEILTRRKPPDLTPQQEREWQQQLDRAADPIALLDDGLSADVQKLLRDFADNRNGFTADSVNRSFLELIAPELPPREAVLDELRQAYAQEQPQLITDFMGYNTGEPEHGASGVNWVGDLILECDVQHDQAQGELTLELSKGVDRFQAHFDLASGQCNLFRVGQDKPLNDQPKPTALKGGGKHSVRFANVDQRLTVWVDDALPFGDGVPYDPPKTEGPTKENDLDPANIGMKGVGGTVSGLRLWRDTYYTIARNGDPTVPDAGSGVDFADPTWDKLRDLPTRTMYVQPGNYLCLGDNSPRSSDGRFWGLVPERLLLGKAVVIFYPIDRIARIK